MVNGSRGSIEVVVPSSHPGAEPPRSRARRVRAAVPRQRPAHRTATRDVFARYRIKLVGTAPSSRVPCPIRTPVGFDGPDVPVNRREVRRGHAGAGLGAVRHRARQPRRAVLVARTRRALRLHVHAAAETLHRVGRQVVGAEQVLVALLAHRAHVATRAERVAAHPVGAYAAVVQDGEVADQIASAVRVLPARLAKVAAGGAQRDRDRGGNGGASHSSPSTRPVTPNPALSIPDA